MQACGVGLLPYFPLASGLLTGKYRRDFIPEGTRLATPRPHEVVFRDKADWALIDALDSTPGSAAGCSWSWRSVGCSRRGDRERHRRCHDAGQLEQNASRRVDAH